MTIVGSGRVGAAAAHEIARGGYADLVLVDVDDGLARGVALDIVHAGAVAGYDGRVRATNSYEDTVGSAVVVVAAGNPRMPGMTRRDLFEANAPVVSSAISAAYAVSPDAVFLIVTNPLDAMCQVAAAACEAPRERLFGMAGVLDSARFATFLACEADVSTTDANALVVGTHDDGMVPLASSAAVGGIPVAQLLSGDQIEEAADRTRVGGDELIGLLGRGPSLAAGAAIARTVSALARDERCVLPCTVRLSGEYGLTDVFLGVPAVLGAAGLVRVVEVEMDHSESRALEDAGRAALEVSGQVAESPYGRRSGVAE